MKYGIEIYTINKEGKESEHKMVVRSDSHAECIKEMKEIRHMFSHTNEILCGSTEKVSFYMDGELVVYQLVRPEEEG